ncbi:related to P-type ATPase [Rhynchosporium agropyri]|uniref:Related to P-type ATPase n=1 Tax=Rhynchosporium agropyri TaxID=914238 RepID=A0A1E1K4W0_9HELO|nr:related to P-type ATPase [Rhynchosporium agropyri]
MAPCCSDSNCCNSSKREITSTEVSTHGPPFKTQIGHTSVICGSLPEILGELYHGNHHHGYHIQPAVSLKDTLLAHKETNPCSKTLLHPPAPASGPSKVSSCSEKLCCVRKLSGHVHEIDTDSTTSQSCVEKIGEDSQDSSSTIVEIDDNGISYQVERVVLNVQGMTCTGCESNLRKVLDSIGAISNIKTSLLLAETEFNLKPSEVLHSGNIAHVIEQMTGFSCIKANSSGEELDIILPAGVSVPDGPFPSGLTSMISVGREKIRITYDPKVVGARTLLQDPFFHSAQFASALTSRDVPSGRKETHKSLLLTAISVILTIPVLVLAYANLPDRNVVYGSISLVLATLVQLVAHGFYIKAYKTLRYSRMIEMDMLVVLSTTTAYVYSVIAFAFMAAGRTLSTGDFFETSTLLITLVLVGRTAAAYSRHKAVESISIQSLQVQNAIIFDPKDRNREIDSRLLQYGDIFQVLPDTRIVTDGKILEGETEVDESLITGESTLCLKKPGMTVIAGSINHSGRLLVELTRLPSENTIQSISAMVDEAKSSKARVQEIADRVAGYFTPVVIGIAIIVFVAWVSVGKALRHESTSTACIHAMTYAISTLIVSCPCAIGLAVPMVLLVAGGVGARYGLIFKTAGTIEIGRKISHVIFDKTGTLTQGNPSVVDSSYLTTTDLSSVILALTNNSKHPVSSGVNRLMQTLQSEVSKPVHLEHVISVPGKGIVATSEGLQIRGGSAQWLGVENSPVVQKLLQRKLTIFCVDVSGSLAAVFGLQDQLRPDSLSTIQELKRRGISISLLSGDNEHVVKAIGEHLGIAPEKTRSCCTPAQKQAYVKKQLAIPNSTVLFCGDGTNDAVALAQASIGMHMGGGTDVAQSAADAILMNSSLKRIITLIDLSRSFHRRVVFNFIWSFVYNVFAILLAAGVFPKVRIPPAYAGLGELVSVLPVIAIAMQLRWKKF